MAVLVLLDYLFWLRDRVLAAASKLPPETFTSGDTVTTRDLRATLVHELDVEWSWRERLRTRGFPDEEDLEPDDYPTLAALADHWARDEAEMRAWVANLTDAELATPPPGEDHPIPLWYYLMHLLMHAAQQFNEAAVLLTRAGCSPGELGFLEFADQRTRMTEPLESDRTTSVAADGDGQPDVAEARQLLEEAARNSPTSEPPVRNHEDPDPQNADAAGDPVEYAGNDNIRQGNVGGLMGGPRQSEGQGQGG